MGNQSCVSTGGAPHQMTIELINTSGGDIELDPSKICECPERHQGFHAAHGKFNFEPARSIHNGYKTIIKVSGREASAVNPVGWIQYRWCENHSAKLYLDYNSAGWTDLQNRSFISAICRGTNKYGVSVEQVDNRGYKITITPFAQVSTTVASGGQYAEDRIMGLIWTGFADLPCHPEELGGSRIIRSSDFPNIKKFPCVLNSEALYNAVYDSIPEGYSCGGVAIQRAWWLLFGRCDSQSARKVGKAWKCGGCIASDLITHCKNDGLAAGHVDNWNDAKYHLSNGCVLFTVLNGTHWVTVIGVYDSKVYAIDYNGLVSVLETVYVGNVKPPSGIVANGSMIWVKDHSGGGDDDVDDVNDDEDVD
jgi:hypothetical protein